MARRGTFYKSFSELEYKHLATGDLELNMGGNKALDHWTLLFVKVNPEEADIKAYGIHSDCDDWGVLWRSDSIGLSLL